MMTYMTTNHTAKVWDRTTYTNEIGGSVTRITHLPTGHYADRGPGAKAMWRMGTSYYRSEAKAKAAMKEAQ